MRRTQLSPRSVPRHGLNAVGESKSRRLQFLQTPLNGKIFFAGEAMYDQIGATHLSALSGEVAARHLVSLANVGTRLLPTVAPPSDATTGGSLWSALLVMVCLLEWLR